MYLKILLLIPWVLALILCAIVVTQTEFKPFFLLSLHGVLNLCYLVAVGGLKLIIFSVPPAPERHLSTACRR
jgi:hypothetical protein